MDSEIKEEISTLVRTGLFNEAEVLAKIERIYFDSKIETTASIKTYEPIVRDEFVRLANSLPKNVGQTSVARLYKAGEFMQGAGIKFLANFADTPSEVSATIKQRRKQNPKEWEAYSGYCAFTLFDVTECFRNNSFYLSCSSLKNSESDSLKRMRIVADILRKERFKVDWDDQVSERIKIAPFEWALS